MAKPPGKYSGWFTVLIHGAPVNFENVTEFGALHT